MNLSALRTLIALKDAIGNKEPHQPRSVTAAALAKAKRRKEAEYKMLTLTQRYGSTSPILGMQYGLNDADKEEFIKKWREASTRPGAVRVHDEIVVEGNPKAQYTAPTIEVTEIDTKNF